jgi:hypothetical protein
MDIIKLELEFTESSEYNLKKDYFNSKDVERQVDILNSENRKARKKLGYFKTFIKVTFANGKTDRARFDIGSSIAFLELLSKVSGQVISIFKDTDSFVYSVEEHYDTEGGIGISVYGADLKTLENAKETLKKAKIEMPCRDWVIILTPKVDYSLREIEVDESPED